MPSTRPPRRRSRRPARRRRVLVDEARVVVVRDEADLLAVRLVGDRQPRAARVLADGVLRAIADREDGARELLLRQREQEVRLILRRVDAALQQVAAGRRVALDARVVAGRDRVGAEAARALDQRRELQIAVAVRAGQRRPAGGVLARRSSRRPARRTAARSSRCSAGCRWRAATRRASCRSSSVQQLPNDASRPLGLVVELHRQTDDVVALLGEQRRGHRRIDAARHRDDDAHLAHARGTKHDDGRFATCLRVCESSSHRRSSGQAAQLLDEPRQHLDDAIDFLLASRTVPRLKRSEFCVRCVGQPHRAQHVRRLERARRAGRSGRHRDAFEIERDQQALGLDAIEADVRRVRHARRRARR